MKKTTIFLFAMTLWIGVAAAGEKTVGADGPKMIFLGSLSKVYDLVPFNHAEHVSMGGGCADCHHQHRSMQVQSCAECHQFDPSVFKKNLKTGKLKPCGDCHSPSERPGSISRLGLKDAYHQACFKCHKGDVTGAKKNPKGCTELCHVPKNQEKREEKK